MDPDLEDNLYVSEPRSSGEQTSEEEEAQPQLIVFYQNRKPVPYRLHLGVNVIGRQSSFAQRDAVRLHQWSLDYDGASVHGIFLESSSISSAHAVIYLEGWGDLCYVKDLRSRNKTFVKRGGKHVAIEPENKQPLQSGDTLTFGALKCRVAIGGFSEPGLAPVGNSGLRAPNLSLRTSSRAVSIGQRTASPGTPSGRSPSLDKCPSLQEWFQHPARSGSSGGAAAGSQMSPFSGAPIGRNWTEEEGEGPPDLPSRASFGFGPTGPTIHEAEENTSSDAEPETPRIGRPTRFYSPRVKPETSPFAAAPQLLPVPAEEEEPDFEEPQEFGKPEDFTELGDAGSDKPRGFKESRITDAAVPDVSVGPENGQEEKAGVSERSSLEMGAETLAHLRTVTHQEPGSGAHISQPSTPGTEELGHLSASSPRSVESVPGAQPWVTTPSPTQTGDGQPVLSGRPIRARHKSPTPKRTRSGHVASSPDKGQPRSKSPRLQRGFYVDEEATPSGEQHMKMDEIRDAVRDIWGDM